MVKEEVIALSPSKQQKVHFVGSLGFLHHPQPPCDILHLTLHKRNRKPWKEYLLQNTNLKALMKKTKQNKHSSAKNLHQALNSIS
jgi:hypothetical protein